MEKAHSYRRLRKILKTFGIAEDKSRGKGSERMFVGVVNGIVTRYPTKCHGEGDLKPKGVIRAIRLHFQLTEEFGISDEDFYARG